MCDARTYQYYLPASMLGEGGAASRPGRWAGSSIVSLCCGGLCGSTRHAGPLMQRAAFSTPPPAHIPKPDMHSGTSFEQSIWGRPGLASALWWHALAALRPSSASLPSRTCMHACVRAELKGDGGADDAARIDAFRAALRRFEGSHPFHNYTRRMVYRSEGGTNTNYRGVGGGSEWQGGGQGGAQAGGWVGGASAWVVDVVGWSWPPFLLMVLFVVVVRLLQRARRGALRGRPRQPSSSRGSRRSRSQGVRLLVRSPLRASRPMLVMMSAQQL